MFYHSKKKKKITRKATVDEQVCLQVFSAGSGRLRPGAVAKAAEFLAAWQPGAASCLKVYERSSHFSDASGQPGRHPARDGDKQKESRHWSRSRLPSEAPRTLLGPRVFCVHQLVFSDTPVYAKCIFKTWYMFRPVRNALNGTT